MYKFVCVVLLSMSLSGVSYAGSCSDLSDYAARKACEGDCSNIGDYAMRKACQGDCSNIGDYATRKACQGDCSNIGSYEQRKACESCNGGGLWVTLRSFGTIMSCK